MARFLTEDEVKDLARQTLGLKNTRNAISGIGQHTTFNKLDDKLGKLNIWKGISDQPDGWYFPKKISEPALILEAKNSDTKLGKKEKDELKKNMRIALKGYKDVIGLLYNSKDLLVFKNKGKSIFEIKLADELQSKEYYLKVFTQDEIDKNKIYTLTKSINEILHFQFGIKNLYHRMIFTACALVAKRYSNIKILQKGMDFDLMRHSILNTISKSLESDKKQNQKIDLLAEVYSEIKMNSQGSQEDIDRFIECIDEISNSINSDNWNGEDVMGIFFNEFNRYKPKSESGQVFTPEHITSLMYRLIDVNKDSVVFDGACGSGGFLTKAMGYMLKEAGDLDSKKARAIKREQLYGIEFDREIYALACANMLIHKDGKSNFEQLDTRTEEASKWIRSISFKEKKIIDEDDNVEVSEIPTKHPITKVLMNPPFERKYGCLKIINNVLSNVPIGTQAAIILPDFKLEKDSKSLVRKIFKKNTLTHIIKLPEETFREGVNTSIFLFVVGKPHYEKPIKTFWIKEDGLETVKNQGRQDIYGKWQQIEDFWVELIKGENSDQELLDALCVEVYPDFEKMKGFSYPKEKIYSITSEIDFEKTVFEYLMFQKNRNIHNFLNSISNNVLYYSKISKQNGQLSIEIEDENDE